MKRCEDCKFGPSGACGVKEKLETLRSHEHAHSDVLNRVSAPAFVLEYHRLRQLGPADDQATSCQATVFAIEAIEALERML